MVFSLYYEYKNSEGTLFFTSFKNTYDRFFKAI